MYTSCYYIIIIIIKFNPQKRTSIITLFTALWNDVVFCEPRAGGSEYEGGVTLFHENEKICSLTVR